MIDDACEALLDHRLQCELALVVTRTRRVLHRRSALPDLLGGRADTDLFEGVAFRGHQ